MPKKLENVKVEVNAFGELQEQVGELFLLMSGRSNINVADGTL